MIIPLSGIKRRQKEMSELLAPSQYPTHKLVNQYLWVDFVSVVLYLEFCILFILHSNSFSFIAIPTVCVAFLFIFCEQNRHTRVGASCLCYTLS